MVSMTFRDSFLKSSSGHLNTQLVIQQNVLVQYFEMSIWSLQDYDGLPFVPFTLKKCNDLILL